MRAVVPTTWRSCFLLDGGPRIEAMEGVRAAAALLVFFHHYQRHFPAPALDWLAAIGPAGVPIFFVLSGYLIYGRLLDKPVAYGHYLRQRLRRIYPTYLAVFALYLALHSAGYPSGKPLHPASLLPSAALLPGLFEFTPLVAVAWSLSYELFFYALTPLGIAALGLRAWTPARRCVLIGAVAALYLLAHWRWAALAWPALALRPFAHPSLVLFAAGMLAWEARRWRLRAWGEAVAAALALFALWLFAALQLLPELALHWRTALAQNAVLALCLFWFALYCFSFDGRLKRLFSWPPLRALGNMSYSFYLIHGLAIQAVKMLLVPGPAWLSFALSLLAAFALSLALYLAVERPLSLTRR